MSRESVRLIEQGIRCFNEQDWEGLAERYHPSAVLVAPDGWPESRAEGRDAVVDQFRRIREEGVESYVVVEETVAQGEFVLVRFRWVLTGSATGISEERPMSGLYRVRDRQIVEVRFSWGHAETLEAVGLSE